MLNPPRFIKPIICTYKCYDIWTQNTLHLWFISQHFTCNINCNCSRRPAGHHEMEIYQPSTSSLRWFVFLARRTLNFLFLYFGCLMTRNDYFLDWIFESFQSLLVPCVGLSIIWHLQTDKLRGLSRELVTTPPTYYQVWWTFIILIL